MSLSKAERTRQFIIEQAAPIFNTRGYVGTAMSDILEATQLTKGCVYGHFTNKDELAGAAFSYAYGLLTDKLRAVILPEKTSYGRMRAVLAFYREYARKPVLDGGCPILNTATDVDDTHPVLKALAGKAMESLLQDLDHILRQGVKYGEFRPDLDTRAEAEMIFALIEGSVMMTKLMDKPGILKRNIDLLETRLETYRLP